jgi:hypothetical protein
MFHSCSRRAGNITNATTPFLFYGVLFVFSRSRLKSGLLICTIVFASAVLFQLAWSHSIRVANALVILETGSAASAVAISIVLIATI